MILIIQNFTNHKLYLLTYKNNKYTDLIINPNTILTKYKDYKTAPVYPYTKWIDMDDYNIEYGLLFPIP